MPSLKRGQWEWRKIRRSFERKERDGLIQEFERYNENISRYVEQREILAPSVKPRPEEYSKYYYKVRENACGLYEALETGWKCRCMASHKAKLQLERRSEPHVSQFFNLSLSFLNQRADLSQKAWLGTQINVDDLSDGEIGEAGEKEHKEAARDQKLPHVTTTSSNLGPTTTHTSLSCKLGKRSGPFVKIIEPIGSHKPPRKTINQQVE